MMRSRIPMSLRSFVVTEVEDSAVCKPEVIPPLRGAGRSSPWRAVVMTTEAEVFVCPWGAMEDSAGCKPEVLQQPGGQVKFDPEDGEVIGCLRVVWG